MIETRRLRLRRHRLDDFAECAALWADPQVTRYIGGKPLSAEDAWAKLLRYAGHWTLLGYGFWVIEDKATGAFVGEAGFANYKRDTDPDLGDGPEAGWVLASRAHGKGYATEAVQAALSWGDAHFGPVRSVCLIDPGNLASLRVAAKCGFREFAHGTYRGHPTILLERRP